MRVRYLVRVIAAESGPGDNTEPLHPRLLVLFLLYSDPPMHTILCRLEHIPRPHFFHPFPRRAWLCSIDCLFLTLAIGSVLARKCIAGTLGLSSERFRLLVAEQLHARTMALSQVSRSCSFCVLFRTVFAIGLLPHMYLKYQENIVHILVHLSVGVHELYAVEEIGARLSLDTASR